MDLKSRLEFIFHSNRLDGIAVAGEDTYKILNGQWNRPDVEAQTGKTYAAEIVKSHDAALDYIIDQASQFGMDLEERHVSEIHSTLMNGVLLSHGEYRECLLRIQGLNPFPTERIRPFLSQVCDRTNKGLADESIDKGKLAWLAHHDIFYCHPFIEGNGRTARLFMNLIRLRAGLPVAIIRANDFKAYTQGILDYAQRKITMETAG